VVDPFFAQGQEEEEEEKRVVAKDGVIPKLAKNLRKEVDYQANRQKKMEEAWGKKIQAKPIKINPGQYRVSKGALPGKSNHH